MKVIERDIWLCNECVQAAVNNDFTSLDYYYGPREAQSRMKEIEQGLKALGPHLVPDWREEGVQEYECVDCDHTFIVHGSSWDSEDEDVVAVCPECKSENWVFRESGQDKFSRMSCDCCGDPHHGARHRFAILGE